MPGNLDPARLLEAGWLLFVAFAIAFLLERERRSGNLFPPVPRPQAGRFGRVFLPWGMGTVLTALLVHHLLTVWFFPSIPYAGAEGLQLEDRLRFFITEKPFPLFLQVSMFAVVVLSLVMGVNNGKLADLGLGRRHLARRYWTEGLYRYGLLLSAAVGTVFLLTLVVYFSGIPLPEQSPDPTIVLLEDASPLLFFTLAALLGPFGEELFFRGLIYPVMSRMMGVYSACMLSAVVFSLSHGGQGFLGFVVRALLGMYLAWCYERSGSLLVPFIVHALYNASVYGVYWLI